MFRPCRIAVAAEHFGAIFDGEGFMELWSTIVGLILSGFVMIPFGVFVFSIGERYAKRTGRPKRSG